MPLQNRVDPWGQLHAVPARGSLLGNRGILHNRAQEIVTPWKTKAWITCQLVWKGRRRTLMRPGSYTELFFLDEVTAFAVGHRPCAECRRARFTEFKTAWLAANPGVTSSAAPPIAEIDKVIHAERTRKGGGKVIYEEAWENVPDGAIVELDTGAYLRWQGWLLRWSFHGYTQSEMLRLATQRVRVLTPASIVQMFRCGFRPDVYESVSLVGNT